MKKDLLSQISIDDHLGCLGNFDVEDPLCIKHCALNLRCAINRDKNVRLELLEDLMSYNGVFIKMQ
jgi:hypothetical protein